jgi:hypothetical protein
MLHSSFGWTYLRCELVSARFVVGVSGRCGLPAYRQFYDIRIKRSRLLFAVILGRLSVAVDALDILRTQPSL